MPPFKFKLTDELKEIIQDEIDSHRANPNRKKDKTAVQQAFEKVITSQRITDRAKTEAVKKVRLSPNMPYPRGDVLSHQRSSFNFLPTIFETSLRLNSKG